MGLASAMIVQLITLPPSRSYSFLTNYQWTTNLTRHDVHTGMAWLHAMDDAALEANVTVQLCMMEPTHVLASTELGAVTNGRGTSDNSHNSQADLYPLGHSGLLHWAMGIWPSRDNVFTSPDEPGCADGKPGRQQYNCSAADYRLQTVAAVLCGGPYGPSDGIDFLNKELIERSCRTDGVLLKADEPLATTDAAMLLSFTDAPRAVLTMHVWATRSMLPAQLGSPPATLQQLCWLYVLSVSTPQEMELRLVEDLGAAPGIDYVLLDFWASNGSAPTELTPVRASNGSFIVPRSPPPPNIYSDAGTYQVLSPVLPGSGWCLLGEARKIVSAATRRFLSVGEGSSVAAGGDSGAPPMHAALRAASRESVVLWVLPPSTTRALLASSITDVLTPAQAGPKTTGLIEVICAAASCFGDDCDVQLALTCETARDGTETCTCVLGKRPDVFRE